MDHLIDNAAQNIAKNLSSLRKQAGLSQENLAKISGVKRASIALLESGSSNPTLEILLKLTQGLKVSIDELLSSPRAECQLIRAKDIPQDKRTRAGVTLKKLLPDNIPATEIDELILEPEAILTGSPHIEGTKEYFTCIKGKVMIAVLGEKFILEKGDVISFPGDKPHSYKNVGTTSAQGIGVVIYAKNF